MLKRIDDLNFYELLEVSPDASTQDIHRAYDRARKVYEPNSIALYSLLSPEETDKIRQRLDEAYRTLIYDETRREYDRNLRMRHELPEPPPPKPKYQPRPAPQQTPPPPRDIVPPLPVGIPASPAITVPPTAAPAAALIPAAQAAPEPAQARPPQQETLQPPPAMTEFTGAVIRILREQKNLTLQGVADATKVSARHLQHIEEEAFAKLPPRPYLRGFLGLFAKALGFEPDRIVNDYMKRYDAAMNPPKK